MYNGYVEKKKYTRSQLILLAVIVGLLGFFTGKFFSKVDGQTANSWKNSTMQCMYCTGFTMNEGLDKFNACNSQDFETKIKPLLPK
jgi:hypothetical protein